MDQVTATVRNLQQSAAFHKREVYKHRRLLQIDKQKLADFIRHCQEAGIKIDLGIDQEVIANAKELDSSYG